MKKLIATLFSIAAALIAVPVAAQSAAPDLVSRIAANVEQHAVVRAEFTQSKQVAAMKRPLTSSGHLVFSRQHGVLWQIEQPYRMTYILGEERVVEINAEGVRRERNVRDLPGMAQVGRVFRALLGANTAALRDYFDIKAQGDLSKWDIALQPRQAHMAQFLESVQIGGGNFITSIRINEAGGDKTVIQLRNTTAASALDAAELRLFNGGSSAP